MSDLLLNKVAASGLLTLDLEHYMPRKRMVTFDMKEHLFMGMILKEKDFREGLKSVDWQQYKDQYVAIICSVDAVIPVWAYMLLATYLQPVAADIFLGPEKEMQQYLFLQQIASVDLEAFRDQRVVVKGCGETPIPEYAYTAITKVLLPVAKSIMYGEPCSTVPVYKKR
jgi:hypothetical protein